MQARNNLIQIQITIGNKHFNDSTGGWRHNINYRQVVELLSFEEIEKISGDDFDELVKMLKNSVDIINQQLKLASQKVSNENAEE